MGCVWRKARLQPVALESRQGLFKGAEKFLATGGVLANCLPVEPAGEEGVAIDRGERPVAENLADHGSAAFNGFVDSLVDGMDQFVGSQGTPDRKSSRLN